MDACDVSSAIFGEVPFAQLMGESLDSGATMARLRASDGLWGKPTSPPRNYAKKPLGGDGKARMNPLGRCRIIDAVDEQTR